MTKEYSSEEIKIYVGKQIKAHRERKKLSQRALAAAIGKKFNTISNYENGKSSPSRDALFAIARVLNIGVDELFPKVENSISLDILKDESENISLENMQFLKDLTAYVESLTPEQKNDLINNIHIAVEIFKNSKKGS